MLLFCTTLIGMGVFDIRRSILNINKVVEKEYSAAFDKKRFANLVFYLLEVIDEISVHRRPGVNVVKTFFFVTDKDKKSR